MKDCYREIQRLFSEGKSIEYLVAHFNLTEKQVKKLIGTPPCVICKNYNNCPYGKGRFYEVEIAKNKIDVPWYDYFEIIFCPFQVLFIIENLEVLRVGKWPSHPCGSGYVDPKIIQGSYAHSAYFTKPSDIVAEMDKRLAKVPKDAREALIDEVNAGITKMDNLSRPARRALMYVKGKRGKKSYSDWQRQRSYREKKVKSLTTVSYSLGAK